jgi:sugar phosphate isomerase/epimerase
MNRRQFLATATSATTAVSLGTLSLALRSSFAAAPKWPIGCFNRPWSKWGTDAALDGVRDAGYPIVGLLTRSRNEPFIGADATPEYLAELKKKIAARKLKANMGALRILTNGVEEGARDLRKQIDNAKALDLEYVLTFGVDKAAEFQNFYKIMADGAAYAQGRGIKLVLKPHGGGSGASEEILRCIKEINHPNFKIWYDAGNIIYYTGKDPLAELEPIVQHVTGFCAKDCAAPKAEVMTQLGTGKVDFRKVFARLKAAGFNGPIMLEGSAPGNSAAEATANARANREFLEKVLASI